MKNCRVFAPGKYSIDIEKKMGFKNDCLK